MMGNVQFGNVSQKWISHAGTGGQGETLAGASHRTAIKSLRQIHHFHQFIPDMARPLCPLGFGQEVTSTNESIGQPGLTTAVVLAVGSGKPLHQFVGKLIFPTHEDMLPGNKNLVKHNKSLAANNTIFRVALVHGTVALASIVGLPTKDVDYAGGIHRHIKTYRVVSILLLHGTGRHHQMAM